MHATDPDALARHAAALGKTGRVDEALGALEVALSRRPDHAVALSLRAALLSQARRFVEADAAFAALLRHHADDWHASLNHGHFLKTVGRVDAAIAAYRHAIARSPTPGRGYWAIANLRPACLDAHDVAAMTGALGRARDDDERVHLHFALGKALDRPGSHGAAFEHLRAGNAMRRARAPYDAGAAATAIRRGECLLTPALYPPGDAPRSDGPIFIVGMPRSGSSLVEQILVTHPLVEGAGELHALHAVIRSLPPRSGSSSGSTGPLDAVLALPPHARLALGERYLTAARRHLTGARPFFTDKMPSNWLYAGIIPLILPGARIVDVRRGAMACGFANFSQLYASGNDFAYDLADIGRFQGEYARHMAHVDRVAPGRICRIDHEALVADADGEIARLLASLGLPFDAACLRFHENPRPVHTPSTDQVRRPVNRAGVDRWRAYDQWLDPLRAGLAQGLR